MNIEQRIIQLEELSAHQDELLRQLDKVIIDLRREIDDLRAKTSRQQDQIGWLNQNLASEPRLAEDEKPPHY